MRTHISSAFGRAVLLSCILLASCSTSKSTKDAGEAGFTVAYFSATDLNAVMRDTECVKARFYNARRTAADLNGSVIMIGIKADGTELNMTMLYNMYDRLTSDMVASISLGKDDAHKCCMFIPPAQKRFCAEFTREEIAALLAVNTCSAVQLKPQKTTRGFWSMLMSPVKLSGTTATVLTSVHPVFCTQPCPDICGPMVNYINY